MILNHQVLRLIRQRQSDSATTQPHYPTGVSPSNLQIAYYNTATSSWVTLTTTEVDTTNHFIYAQISHFTSYALTYGVPANSSVATTTTTPVVTTTTLVVTTTATPVVTTTTTSTPVVTTTTPIVTTTTPLVTTTTTTPVVTPLPATFETSALSISPSEINTGDTDTIQAKVTNSGDVSGTYTAVLKIDGNIESTKDLALTAGEAQNVVFSVSENTAGTYSVDVDGQTGTLTVKAASSSKSFLARDWWLLLVLIIIVALITYIVVSTTRKKDSSKNK